MGRGIVTRLPYNGRLEMIKWMRRKRLPLGRRCDRSCCRMWTSGNTNVVARERLPDVCEDACSEAVENEAWECLKYLVDNKCPNWEDYVSIIPEWVKQKQRG